MTTALDVITDAMKLLGVLFKSETPSADEAADGLTALNDLLDSWSNDGLMTPSFAWENFPLTAGTATYTIGSGGTFNTSRPITIAAAFVRVGTIDHPLDIITPEQYETDITVKTIASTYPRFMVYDNAHPLSTIYLYPVPASSATTLHLLSNKALDTYTSTSDTVTVRAGRLRAMKHNLALELAPQFGVEPSAALVRNAKDSLGLIKKAASANAAMPPSKSLANNLNVLSGIT